MDCYEEVCATTAGHQPSTRGPRNKLFLKSCELKLSATLRAWCFAKNSKELNGFHNSVFSCGCGQKLYRRTWTLTFLQLITPSTHSSYQPVKPIHPVLSLFIANHLNFGLSVQFKLYFRFIRGSITNSLKVYMISLYLWQETLDYNMHLCHIPRYCKTCEFAVHTEFIIIFINCWKT